MKTKKKTINVDADELDMFTKHGVKVIIAGSKKYNLVKIKKSKK